MKTYLLGYTVFIGYFIKGSQIINEFIFDLSPENNIHQASGSYKCRCEYWPFDRCLEVKSFRKWRRRVGGWASAWWDISRLSPIEKTPKISTQKFPSAQAALECNGLFFIFNNNSNAFILIKKALTQKSSMDQNRSRYPKVFLFTCKLIITTTFYIRQLLLSKLLTLLTNRLLSIAYVPAERVAANLRCEVVSCWIQVPIGVTFTGNNKQGGAKEMDHA